MTGYKVYTNDKGLVATAYEKFFVIEDDCDSMELSWDDLDELIHIAQELKKYREA